MESKQTRSNEGRRILINSLIMQVSPINQIWTESPYVKVRGTTYNYREMTKVGFTTADLVGTWIFVDWSITSALGDVRRPFQPRPQGYLLYSEDGVMSAVIHPGQRPRFASNDIRKHPAQDKAAAFDTYFHYAGTWTVQADTVVHHVTSALNPNMIGSDQVRSVTLVGDDLLLSAEEALEGGHETRRHVLTWRRYRKP